MLWEIGRDGAEVRALRIRLGSDSGHLSRLLRALETDGLVTVHASSGDGRVRMACLTEAGLTERAVIDERSDDLARSLLTPLSRRQQDRLVAAMQEVENLLTAASVTIRAVDPSDADARAGIRAYLAELDRRFLEGFDSAIGVTAEPHELRPPTGEMLVAYLHSDPVGCGAVKHHRAEGWVGDQAGLGGRLRTRTRARPPLDRRAGARASDAGAEVVRLDTHRSLTEATALYRSVGYREIGAYNDNPYAHHWFEKTLL